MTSVTTKLEAAQLLTESASQLFDDWFDPIEAGIRDRVREFIEEMIRGEARRCLVANPQNWKPSEGIGQDNLIF